MPPMLHWLMQVWLGIFLRFEEMKGYVLDKKKKGIFSSFFFYASCCLNSPPFYTDTQAALVGRWQLAESCVQKTLLNLLGYCGRRALCSSGVGVLCSDTSVCGNTPDVDTIVSAAHRRILLWKKALNIELSKTCCGFGRSACKWCKCLGVAYRLGLV